MAAVAVAAAAGAAAAAASAAGAASKAPQGLQGCPREGLEDHTQIYQGAAAGRQAHMPPEMPAHLVIC